MIGGQLPRGSLLPARRDRREIPSLAERPGDAGLLAKHFLHASPREMNPQVKGFAPSARSRDRRWGWPGNVRELENRMKRAVIMADGKLVTAEDLDLDGGADGLPVNLKSAREGADRARSARRWRAPTTTSRAPPSCSGSAGRRSTTCSSNMSCSRATSPARWRRPTAPSPRAPRNVEALVLRGILTRSQYGLAASSALVRPGARHRRRQCRSAGRARRHLWRHGPDERHARRRARGAPADRRQSDRLLSGGGARRPRRQFRSRPPADGPHPRRL
jgi:hypothetical protein